MSNTQNNKINKYIVCIAHPAYKNEWYEQIFETTRDNLKKEVTKKIYEEVYESLKDYVDIVEDKYYFGGTNDLTVEKIKKYYEVGVYDEYGMNSDPWSAYNVINGKWIDITPTYEELYNMFLQQYRIMKNC
jgi:hypothetical protein